MTNEPLMTPEEVAAMLKVSIRYVWRLGREGELERVKVGKYVRFTQAGVLAYIECGRERPRAALSNAVTQLPQEGRRRFNSMRAA